MGADLSCVSSREPATQHTGWEHQGTPGMKAPPGGDMARRPSKHVNSYEEHYDRPSVGVSSIPGGGGASEPQQHYRQGSGDIGDGAFYK